MPEMYLTDKQVEMISRLAEFNWPVDIRQIVKTKADKDALRILSNKGVLLLLVADGIKGVEYADTKWTINNHIHCQAVSDVVTKGKHHVRVVIAPKWVKSIVYSNEFAFGEDYPVVTPVD